MYPSCWRGRVRATVGCGEGCGVDAEAAAAAAAVVGTCSSGDPWRRPSCVPCQLCAGWSGPPGSAPHWLCAGAQTYAPDQHWRSAEHCSPASGIPADIPGHLLRSCDRQHARDLRDEEREDKGKGEREERRVGSMQERGESSPTQACRKILRWRRTYTQQAHIGGNKWSREGEWKYKVQERAREKEREKWDGMLDYLPPGQSSSLQNYWFQMLREEKLEK